MWLRFSLIFILLLCGFMFLSCSRSEDKEKPGSIEKATEKIAQETIDYIKTPIDQAKLAKELSESHNSMIEDAIKQQE